MGTDLVQCYNLGCGKTFDPSENNAESCSYHPDPPYFHDAYKIWNCCNKKSTDFGTFLNYPGCMRGKHSNEKKPDVLKVAAVKEIRPEKEEDVIVWKGLNKSAKKKEEQGERTSMDLKIEVTAGAKAAYEKYLNEATNKEEEVKLEIGTPCKNNGCDKVYDGQNLKGNCQHHPGEAVFHEGMKYWSCCQKKTSNFGAFLEQAGCEKGDHLWKKNEVVSKIREDWFSSNGCVTINVYCKGTLEEKTQISSNGHTLNVKICHGFGTKETALEYDLWDEIIPEESHVVIGERKVEIVLKQKHMTAWPRLQYDEQLDSNA